MKMNVFIGMFVGGCTLTNTCAVAQNCPNVICVLADDVGYMDVGCYGATKIHTPALDTLASEGVRFTNAYSPASTSSPSRYALLTGEYAWRKNVGILPADAPMCIDTMTLTLPKVMKRLGYHTGFVGKWHLGLGSEEHPVNFNEEIMVGPPEIGFEDCYYFPATNDRVPCVYIENKHVDGWEHSDPITISYKEKVGNWPTGKEHPEMLKLPYYMGHDGTIVNGISRIGWMAGGTKALWKDEDMARHLLERVKDFVKTNKKRPFFLYYAPHNAHEPRVPSKGFLGKSEAGIYGDVIEEFDYCVGELVKTLKEEGIYENTILIVTSDNAPMVKEGYVDGALENLNGHNPFGNMRGMKYSLHEGGNKVPFIYSWPARVHSPFVQDQPFIYLDLLSTIPALLGRSFGMEGRKDSRDASALFLSADAPRYREYIMTQNNVGQVSLRMGRWKFLPGKQISESELYDLENDPSESRNLADVYPVVVEQMWQIVRKDRWGEEWKAD